MKSSNIKYLPALDHLRAFAVIIVMVYHGILMLGGFLKGGVWVFVSNPVLALFAEGHTAVSLFMVLSGFIFTFGAWGRKVDYFGFIKNSFLRIYPLFLFLIFLGIALYPDRFNFTGLLKTVFFLSYGEGALNLNTVSALFWTISVEFQFYLVFPFIFYAMSKYGPAAIIAMLALSLPLRIVLVKYFGLQVDYVAFWTLPGRIDQFLAGMLAASVFVSGASAALRRCLVPSVALAIGSAYLYHMLGGWVSGGFWKLLYPLFEGAVWAFFLLCYASSLKENRGWLTSALSRVGEMSYSFYLLHLNVWYVFYMKGWLLRTGYGPVADSFVNSAFFIFPATLAASAITYNVIERPFLKLRGRYLKSHEA